MMKPSILRREWALLILPVLLLVGVGVWAQKRSALVASTATPTPTPGPFRLEIKEFKKVPLTPYEVSLGADTKVTLTVVTAGQPPAPTRGGWEVVQSAAIYSLKTGQPVPDQRGEHGKIPLLSGGGGGLSDPTHKDWSYKMEQLMRLNKVPAKQGALELRYNWAIGPNISPAPGQSRADVIQGLMQSKSVPTLSAKMPLREAGETIKAPPVSTDPLFDARGIKITPSKQAIRSGPVKVVVDVFYRGSKMTRQSLPTQESWEMRTRNGVTLSRGDSMDWFNRPGTQRRGQLTRDFDFSSQKNRMKGQPLVLRGKVSVDGAWPRTVEIPIP